jgi:hypothetical protein
MQHEEMLRAIALELESAHPDPQIADWARAHVEPFRRQARHLQKLLRGEGDNVDNPLEREFGAAAPPPRRGGN